MVSLDENDNRSNEDSDCETDERNDDVLIGGEVVPDCAQHICCPLATNAGSYVAAYILPLFS